MLVAYEFSAAEEGVYVLGSNKKCRIVYFSADSSASSGRDGVTSYKMGTIDFVYDNGSAVLTVKNGDTVVDGNYSYNQYYYPTLCLLYTDNLANSTGGVVAGDTDYVGYFPNINDFKINIRRYVSAGEPVINWTAYGGTKTGAGKVLDAVYIQLNRYSYSADGVNRNTDAIR